MFVAEFSYDKVRMPTSNNHLDLGWWRIFHCFRLGSLVLKRKKSFTQDEKYKCGLFYEILLVLRNLFKNFFVVYHFWNKRLCDL